MPWVIGGFACLLLFLGLGGGIAAFVYRAELSNMFPKTEMADPAPYETKGHGPYDPYGPPGEKSAAYPDRAAAGCPGGHALAEFRTQNSNYRCDVCSRTLPRGTRAFGCRICDWDKCERCDSGP